jgi:hypothetical protein
VERRNTCPAAPELALDRLLDQALVRSAATYVRIASRVHAAASRMQAQDRDTPVHAAWKLSAGSGRAPSA